MKKNLFNSVMVKTPNRNTFDLSHTVLMTGQMGNLMPTLVMEVVPGDHIKLACDHFIRLQPMVFPVMHRIDVYQHYFFVPNRLVWENWEDYITNQSTGGIPQIESNGAWTAAQKKFGDYMGIPPFSAGTGQLINAIPFAAYQMIWNEYYRDQNLITEIDPQLADGTNALGIFATMRKRAWEHDYFTSALPTAQMGAVVDIPLGEITLKTDWDASSGPGAFLNILDIATDGDIVQAVGDVGINPTIPGAVQPAAYDPRGTLEVGATTINDLRRAFKLQEWLELMMRGGKRYIEQMKAHFDIISSDKRLQRPEYITGTKSPIVISEVLQTSETDVTAQGSMAGHGIAVGDGYTGRYFAEEHGYIIGVMSIIPKPMYMQGIAKHYLVTDPLEKLWPKFAHLGEQEITRAEIWAYDAAPSTLFGYIPRYSEYRYMPSRVAGDFRTSLEDWHLGRIFGSVPALNQTFIEVDPAATDRIFAVDTSTVDKLLINILHKIVAKRPLPMYGTPTL